MSYSIKNRVLWTPLAVSFALLLTLVACDTTSPEPEVDEQEAEAVADIMANALSDRSDGMMAGLYDLTASVSRTGLSYGDSAEKRHVDRDWRGRHRDFAAEYNPETGEHLIQYRREVDRPGFYKSVGVNLSYIFEDVDGTFLEFPRRQYDDIAVITFEGTRKGETQIRRDAGSFESTFDRQAQWVLGGLEDGSEVMELGGTQSQQGTQRIQRGDRVRTRNFMMRLNIVDVTIEKPTSDDDPIEERISGTIEYQVSVTHTINGEERTHEYRGTVELDGKGAARLRLMGFRNPFFINLANGDVERS